MQHKLKDLTNFAPRRYLLCMQLTFRNIVYFLLALCPTLSQIDNGTLIFNSDSPDGSRTNGTVALYSCSDGFMLDGLDNRTCFNGVWNGEEDPMCIASKPWVHVYMVLHV